MRRTLAVPLKFSSSIRELFEHVTAAEVFTLIFLALLPRLLYLDQAYPWHDEYVTAVRSSGLAVAELQEVLIGGPRSAPETAVDLRRPWAPYQNDILRDVTQILHSSFREPHLPLFYILIRCWNCMFDDWLFGGRAFSVASGILAIIGISKFFALCNSEQRTLSPGLLLAILSPSHILFSREARMYSLLGALAIWLVVALGRYSLERRRSWLIVAFLCVVAGALTHVAFLAFLFGALIAFWFNTLVLERDLRFSISTTCAILLGVAPSAPWTSSILCSHRLHEHFSFNRIAVEDYFYSLLSNFAFGIVDGTGLSRAIEQPHWIPIFLLAAAVSVLGCAGWVSLFKHSSTARLLGSGILVSFLSLIASDLISGGHKATIFRYMFIPSWFVLIGMSALVDRTYRNRFAWVTYLVSTILVVGMSVQAVLLLRTAAWGKPDFVPEDVSTVAREVRSRRSACLFTDMDRVSVIALSREVHDELLIIDGRNPYLGQSERTECADLSRALFLRPRNGSKVLRHLQGAPILQGRELVLTSLR